jgi:hypothetical protein
MCMRCVMSRKPGVYDIERRNSNAKHQTRCMSISLSSPSARGRVNLPRAISAAFLFDNRYFSRTSLYSGGIILALQTLYPRAPSLTRQIIRSIRDRKAILSLNAVVITIASLARIRHPTPSLRKHTQRTDNSNNRLSSARPRHRVPPLVTIVRVHQFYHSCISTSQPHSRHI